MDTTKILDIAEIVQVLASLRATKRYENTHQNLTIFELSCCYGLRCMEISGLNLGDLVVESARPVVVVRRDNTKGTEDSRRTRKIPLDIDKAAWADIREWVARCRAEGCMDSDPVVCTRWGLRQHKRLSRRRIYDHWLTAVSCLGPVRCSQLSSHSGRHSFGTHALRAGYSLAEVRDWMGHKSIETTNKYTHAIRTELGRDLYG